MVSFDPKVKAIDEDNNVTSQQLREDGNSGRLFQAATDHYYPDDVSMEEDDPEVDSPEMDDDMFHSASQNYFESDMELSFRGSHHLNSVADFDFQDDTEPSDWNDAGMEADSTSDTVPSTLGSEEFMNRSNAQGNDDDSDNESIDLYDLEKKDPVEKEKKEEEHPDKVIAKEMGKGLFMSGAAMLGLPIIYGWIMKLFCRGGDNQEDVATGAVQQHGADIAASGMDSRAQMLQQVGEESSRRVGGAFFQQ